MRASGAVNILRRPRALGRGGRPLNASVRLRSMPQLSWAWRFFLAVEAIAVVADLSYGYLQNALGPFLWGLGFILTLPGAWLVGPLVERALWRTGVGLTSTYLIELFAAVVCNAILWAIGLWVIRRVRRRDAI